MKRTQSGHRQRKSPELYFKLRALIITYAVLLFFLIDSAVFDTLENASGYFSPLSNFSRIVRNDLLSPLTAMSTCVFRSLTFFENIINTKSL